MARVDEIVVPIRLVDCERETRAERFNIAPSGKRFRCNFIEPGIVSYTDCGGDVELLRRETIEEALGSALGNPLTIGHVRTNRMVTSSHGRIENVGRDPETGWFFADGSVDSEEARQLLRTNAKPSCGYTVLEFGPGGTYHNIPYTREIKRIKFHHLAIVDNPRYEGSRFRLNSKTQTAAMKNPFKFLWNIVKPAAEAGGQPITERAEAEVAPDATVEVDGKPVRLNELIAAYQAPARTNEITPESEIEFETAPGKTVKVKFSELTQNYADRLNGVESPAQKEAREKAERESSQREADRKAAEERENGRKAFKVLSSARGTPPPAGTIPVSNNSGSATEGFERGASRYGTPAPAGKN